MAFVSPANAFVLISLLLCSSILVHANDKKTPHYAPAPAPHHHHHHAPTPTPTPAPAPIHPPVKPPVHTPVYPPAKTPVHPPVKAPVHAPVYPPVKTPVHPPVKAPVKPPVYPPVKPPTTPPQRKKVAVQGVVYCKSCKYRGVDTLTNAVPLAGASVKLQCNNTKVPLEQTLTTDKNGYFFFMPNFLTTFAFHKCKVFLVAPPPKNKNCTVPTNLHNGASGAALIPTAPAPVSPKQPELDFVLFTVGPFAFDARKKMPCHY